jgi:hypothetical protein
LVDWKGKEQTQVSLDDDNHSIWKEERLRGVKRGTATKVKRPKRLSTLFTSLPLEIAMQSSLHQREENKTYDPLLIQSPNNIRNVDLREETNHERRPTFQNLFKRDKPRRMGLNDFWAQISPLHRHPGVQKTNLRPG